MSRILVTGASGFVGRALIVHLAGQGHLVRAASRAPLPELQGVEAVRSPDLAGSPDWAPLLEGVDAVIHSAAIAHADGIDEAAYDAINHRAVTVLAEAALGRVERLVFLSSIRAQSGASAPGRLTEADMPLPADAYGRAKLRAEQALSSLGAPAVILRPVLVAGPQPRGNLAALLRLARLPLPLRLDALTAQRSLVALADLCAAATHVLGDKAHIGETYIVASPEPIGIGAMFAALSQGLGRNPGGMVLPRPLVEAALAMPGLSGMREKLFGDLVVSPAKLMATGFAPQVSPRAALVAIGAEARLRQPAS